MPWSLAVRTLHRKPMFATRSSRYESMFETILVFIVLVVNPEMTQ